MKVEGQGAGRVVPDHLPLARAGIAQDRRQDFFRAAAVRGADGREIGGFHRDEYVHAALPDVHVGIAGDDGQQGRHGLARVRVAHLEEHLGDELADVVFARLRGIFGPQSF